jgi:membrane protease YdiL (CAAX protease family)
VTHGFHSIKISTFLIIAILGNMLVFVPLIFFLNDSEQLRNLLLFGVAFSLINAFLEELIWRGRFFSILSNEVSILYALVFTSLAFGLHHIVIGIPFFAAFSFSIGGLFFALVVIKTNSIIPAVLWHFIINMCMVFSGLII